MSDGWYKKKGNPNWYIRTDPLTGTAKCSGVTTVALRELWYEDRLRQKLDPNHKAKTTEGLNTWCKRVIERKDKLRAKGTKDFYETKLGHVLRVIGLEIMKDPEALLDNAFAPDNWDRYVGIRLDEGARPTTILKEIGAGKLVAKAAKRSKAFTGDPGLFRPDDLDNDYKPGSRALTQEEMPLLLDVLNDFHKAHVAASVALATRYSEAFRIQPEHIDLETWTVHVPGTKTKGADDRIPIAEPFRPYLLMALPYLPLRPWDNSRQWRDLKAACERAGIPQVTSNDLRRTHASWLAEAGVPDSITSRVMRHVDERMVRTVYGKARPEKLGAVLDGIFNVTAPDIKPKNDATPAPVQTEAGRQKSKRSDRVNEVTDGGLRVQPAPSPNQKAGGYRGVCWNKRANAWQASVAGGEKRDDGRRKQVYLGTFSDPVQAALAYDAAARKAFGKAALCNFPEPTVTQTLPETVTQGEIQAKTG